jgi:hypothetical protein
MKEAFLARRYLGMAAVTAAFALAPAQAVAAPAASPCPAAQLSQPFLSAGDSNWYTLAPGESAGSFDGGGWVLRGGAKVVSAALADGATGSVLDLPSGSEAVSPAMCVTADYTSARTMEQNVVGSGGVSFSVTYTGAGVSADPQRMGRVHGERGVWTLSRSMALAPADQAGGQRARFTLAAGGHSSEFQVYDFYVDPRMH